jgi:hypothetical protein
MPSRLQLDTLDVDFGDGPPATYLADFTRDDLAVRFAGLGFQTGAEIGVAEGRFSEVICRANPTIHLLCVDPWRPYDGNGRGRPQPQQDAALAAAHDRLAPYHITWVRALSAVAASLVNVASLDFVFIDGNHGEAYVRQDLELWSARVRPGGIISGHDFYAFAGAGVIQAVCAFTQGHHIREWFVTDAVPRRKAHTGELYKEHSFFWVNP